MELDDRVFSDAAFDCYAWLEEAVIDRNGNVPELVSLVPQLTLLSQSLTKSIHATLHQLTVAGPQLQAQLDAMQRATVPLAAQLDSVAASVTVGAHGSASSHSGASNSTTATRKTEQEHELQHLLTLHEAKERLQSCSTALVEAARWEKNVRACAASIDGAMALGDNADQQQLPPTATTTAAAVPSLAQRVNEMRQSLEILRDMPGADDRKRTMERLSTQIGAAIKPKLDAYLQQNSSTTATVLPVARVQFCHAVLRSVGRGEYVAQAFCRVRPAQIHRVWYAYDGGSDSSSSFSAWLDSAFYRDVLRLVQRETEHAVEIFGAAESRDVLVLLLENTLAPLTESFRDRLTTGFCVQELLRAYRASCLFLSHVAKALRSSDAMLVGSHHDHDHDHSDDDDDDDNDRYEQKTMNHVELSSGAHARAKDRATARRLLTAVLAPYQSFFTNYAQFASEPLTRELTSLVPVFPISKPGAKDGDLDMDLDSETSAAVEANTLETYAQQVEDVSSSVCAAVEQSVRLCYEFSGGAAFPEAVRVVSHAVEQLTQRLVASIPAIRAQIGVDALPTTPTSQHEHQHHGLLMADWGRFHSALALLRACGTIESDWAAVDKKLCVLMREQAQCLTGSGSRGRTSRSSSRVAAAAAADGNDAHDHKTSPKMTRKELKRRPSSSSWALRHLSLSHLVAEPARITPTVMMKWLHNEPERESALEAFVGELLQSVVHSSESTTPIFASVRLSLARYRRHVQTLVYDSVFAPIAHVLRAVPANECWHKTPDADLGDLPTFSTLPQEYITLVADLLLSLLPQLEPFAESSSLEKAAIASHDAYKVCFREWATLGQSLRLSSDEIESCTRIFEQIPSEQDAHATSDSDVADAATFVDTWTSAVASGTTAALLSAVTKIPTLSPLGATQLAADVGYFQNVLNALCGGGGDRNFVVSGLQDALRVHGRRPSDDDEELRGQRDQKVQDANEQRIVARLYESVLAKRQLSTGATATTGAAAVASSPAPSSAASQPAAPASHFY